MSFKYAIFQWGEINLHTYYLIEQLTKDKVVVDLYLYTPLFADKNTHTKRLLKNIKEKNIKVIQFKCSWVEAKLIMLNRVPQFFGSSLALFSINPILPYRTCKIFISGTYKYIITISQSSLFWIYRTDKSCLNKVIHYSLEAQQISDPDVINNSPLYTFIKKESKILKLLNGLIIQDDLRAKVLLKNEKYYKNLRLFYIPVSIPGAIIVKSSHYLHNLFGLTLNQQIILYFGSVYEERKVDDLVNAFTAISNKDLVLILHGPGEFSQLRKTKEIFTSNFLLPYDQLHLIISSATIGIALYDNSWPNSRLTAFSSEKIARYLQAGVPFIAFKNESYYNLKNEFDCCELIDDVNELESAINIIMTDYLTYRNNCYEAYEKYYKIENTIKPLLNYLLSDN